MKNKEIEELLNKFRKCPLDDEYALKYKSIDLDLSDVKLLLSYIEQLEKEYNRSLDKLRNLRVENEQLKTNRDKAIEFIEEKRKVFEWYDTDLFYLVSLLKGDSDE